MMKRSLSFSGAGACLILRGISEFNVRKLRMRRQSIVFVGEGNWYDHSYVAGWFRQPRVRAAHS